MKNQPFSTGDLTVIIVTFNSAHCIAALSQGLQGMPQIVFSDNGSEDDTVAQIRRLLPQAHIIEHKANLGFGTANNRALDLVTTQYALLLNPDCLPTLEFFDESMKVCASFPEAAIIAPHLMRRHGELELSYRWPATHWESKGPAAEAPCCVGFACGAALLLNMPLMRTIGFFDESFFLYYEDEDLCQRVFNSGHAIILAPQLSITHLSRGSVKGASPLKFEYLRGFHHAQSKVLFAAKHFGLTKARHLRTKTLLLAGLTVVPRLLLPQPRYIARLFGRIAGLIDRNLSNKPALRKP